MSREPSAEVLAVAARLRALIAEGSYEAGERLGDERTLAATLQVNRSMLRAGIDVLTAAHQLRRTIGRSGGVMVADGRLERHLNTTESLPEIGRRQGVAVTTEVLQVGLRVATKAQVRRLRLVDGAAVYHLVRLRLADGSPLSVEESCLPADLFPRLDREDLSSLYRTLRERYQTGPVFADETLSVVAADALRADQLRIPVGTSLLLVQRVATGASGRPIELGDEWFVADQVRFHLRTYGYVKPQARPASGARTTGVPSTHRPNRRLLAVSPQGGLS